MKRALASLIIVFAVSLAACSQGSEPPAAATAEVGHPQAHSLYTHCGIFRTEFEGRTWYAQPPLHDGSGNPPEGWGNPYQDGTFRVLSPTRAVFSSTNGLTAFFSTTAGPDTGPESCD